MVCNLSSEPPASPPDLGYYTDDELEAIEAREAKEAEANRLWLEPLDENDPAWEDEDKARRKGTL